MDKFEAIKQFNIRWNIKLGNKEKFKLLKNRINALLGEKLKGLIFSEEFDLEFIQIMGSNKIPVNNIVISGLPGWNEESKVLRRLMEYEKEIDYFRAIQILFLSNQIKDELKENLCKEITKIIEVSGYSNIVGVKKDDKYGYIVYPEGEELLDKKVINRCLEDIGEYETAYKLLISTLEKYSDSKNTDIENVEVIDNLRKVLENYLKDKFNNSKQSIDRILKEDVCRYLDGKDINVNIRNMYVNLGMSIEKFSNENTKHTANLNITKQEVELFIYLIGTLVRFLENLE
ncbi:MAG: hypothetical protein ACRC28_00890 [Clostridium sp.]|uniref:hypothetical protein n=1 Tax=Clostridia TaxID=186801 RepID=UPI003F2DF22F